MPYGPVSHPVQLHFVKYIVVLQPRLCRNRTGLGFFPFARHYSGNHYCFLFLRLLRCFSSAGLRINAIYLQYIRFPHSEICGSIHICQYPQLIAAYHVLHRLWEPRHPPCALSYFLLLMPLLLGIVCFCSPYSVQVSSIQYQVSRLTPVHLKLITYYLKLGSHLLLFSLSIIFFQYVKELFYLTPLNYYNIHSVYIIYLTFQSKRGE